jgi:hypothetical protein
VRLRQLPAAAAEGGGELAILEHPADCAAHCAGLDGHDQRVALRRDQLTDPGEIRYHHRATACHRLPDRPRGAVRRRDRHADVGGLVVPGHPLVGHVADDDHPVASRKLRRAVAHVLEHELGVGQRVGQQVERRQDGLGVVDRGQRARAEDHRPGAEAEPRTQLRTGPIGRRERLQVDAPVDEHGRLAAGAEVHQPVDQGLRVRHRNARAAERDAAREGPDPVRPQHVRAPRHRHQRRRAGKRRVRRVAAHPVGMDHVRAQLAVQRPDPAHMRRAPYRRPARPRRRVQHADSGAGQLRRRQRRFGVTGDDHLEPALLHRQREVLHVRVVDRAQHQHAGHATFP